MQIVFYSLIIVLACVGAATIIDWIVRLFTKNKNERNIALLLKLGENPDDAEQALRYAVAQSKREKRELYIYFN